MNPNEYVLDLVKGALQDSTLSVSELVRRAARVARLRDDYQNLWWIEWELADICNGHERKRCLSEIVPHFNKEGFDYFRRKYADAWMNERRSEILKDNMQPDEDDKLLARSVTEMEGDLALWTQASAQVQLPSNLSGYDQYAIHRDNQNAMVIALRAANNVRYILGRIRDRVYSYLSSVEKEIAFGKIYSDIFQENRLYVDRLMATLCPEALSQFTAAYSSMKDDTPESRAHALTSCRRLLKSLADKLYPPSDKPVKGSDGKERVLTDATFVARLWQYVYEKTSKSTSGRLLETQVQDIGNRVDRLNELASKGVHASVAKFEVTQCVMQTYLIIGDLLRLSDNTSAIGEEDKP